MGNSMEIGDREEIGFRILKEMGKLKDNSIVYAFARDIYDIFVWVRSDIPRPEVERLMKREEEKGQSISRGEALNIVTKQKIEAAHSKLIRSVEEIVRSEYEKLDKKQDEVEIARVAILRADSVIDMIPQALRLFMAGFSEMYSVKPYHQLSRPRVSS